MRQLFFSLVSLSLLTPLFTTICLSQNNAWVWMKGYNNVSDICPTCPSNTTAKGIIGTQGVPGKNNTPQALYEAFEWTDHEGNFWLYGGLGEDKFINYYSMLWKYDPQTNEWTSVWGTGTPNQLPSWGTQGIPSSSSSPGNRSAGCTWVDSSGNLWLYGGISIISGSHNDLWKYDIAADQWTWMHGSDIAGVTPHYNGIGTEDPDNTPGVRAETSCSWTDGKNNFWLFGGMSIADNSIWRYNTGSGMWACMKPSGANSFGSMGVPDTSNRPTARWTYASWKDTSGNLWMSSGGKGGINMFNDLWKYDPVSNEWTWMGGAKTLNQAGDYGAICEEEPSNLPRARMENRSRWTDDCGNFWMFGGWTFPSTGAPSLNDLWKYNPSTGAWTWMSGSDVVNQPGVYGTKEVPSVANVPGSRYGSVGWRNKEGLWILGGKSPGGGGHFNDLWKYIPDKPTADFSFTVDGCKVEFKDNSTPNCNEIRSFHWEFGDTASGSNNVSDKNDPVHIYLQSGDYQAKLIVTSCTGNTDTLIKMVSTSCSEVQEKCGEFFLPNSFSPNDDQNNDVFIVRGNCINSMSLMIWNRWGEKVFETNDATVGWDGTFHGEIMPPDVFAYELNAQMNNGDMFYKKGNVALVK